MQEKRNDLVPVSEEVIVTDPEILSVEKPIPIEEAIKGIEDKLVYFQKIKHLCIKFTNPFDWVLQKGVPYLMESGTQKIAIPFGVNVDNVEMRTEWAEDERGRYAIYIVKGRAYSRKLNREVWDEGVCTERDKFFAFAYGQWKPKYEIDIASIIKKAHTNFYNRVIKRLLALTSITKEELKQAGIDLSKLSDIDYSSKKDEKLPSKPKGRPPKEVPPKRPFDEDKEKEAKRGQIMDFCKINNLIYAEVAQLFKVKYKREFANASLDQLLNYKDYLQGQKPEDLRKEIAEATA